MERDPDDRCFLPRRDENGRGSGERHMFSTLMTSGTVLGSTMVRARPVTRNHNHARSMQISSDAPMRKNTTANSNNSC